MFREKFYQEQATIYKKHYCEKCKCSDKPLDIHHKDKNYKNNNQKIFSLFAEGVII